MKTYLPALTACLLIAVSPAAADMLAQWDISQSPKNDRSLAGISTDINIEVSDIIAEGVHLRSGNKSQGQFSAKHWTNLDTDPNQFYQFTVSVTGENSVSLSDLTVPLAREMDCIQFSRGAEKWELAASFDGFESKAFYSSSVDISQSKNTEVIASSFDLNNMIIQSGQTLTFRLYGSGGTFWNNYAGLYADVNSGLTSAILSGQAGAVPEPATASILLVGSVMILKSRRRRLTK